MRGRSQSAIAKDVGSEPSAYRYRQRASATRRRTWTNGCVSDRRKQSHYRSNWPSPWQPIRSIIQPRIKQSSAWRYRPIREIYSIQTDFTNHPCYLQGHLHSSHRIASPPVQCLVNNRLEKTVVFLPVTAGHLKKISQPGALGNLPSQKAPKEKTTGPTVHHLP